MPRPKASTTSKKEVVKTFVPADSEKKLTQRTLLTLLNNYYTVCENKGKSIRFVMSKENSNRNPIDLTKFADRYTLRSQIEKMAVGDKFADSITVPSVQSPLYFLTTYRSERLKEAKAKAPKTGKKGVRVKKVAVDYPIDFERIVKEMGIKCSPDFNGKEFIKASVEYLRSDRFALRLFNKVFIGEKIDAEGKPVSLISRIPIQKSTHAMYKVIQETTANKTLKEIIDMLWKDILTSCTAGKPETVIANAANPILRESAITGKPLFTPASVEVPRVTSLAAADGSQIPIKYADSKTKMNEEESRAARSVFKEYKLIAKAFNAINELRKDPGYGAKYAQFVQYMTYSAQIADEIEAIRISNSVNSQLHAFIEGMRHMCDLFDNVFGPCEEGKDYFAAILTPLQKYGFFVNLRGTGDLKKEIYARKVPVADLVTKYHEMYPVLGNVKLQDMYDVEVYSKLGFYLFNDWKCSQEVVKITKPVRIALGLALFGYVMKEVDRYVDMKKGDNINISITM